MKMDNELQPMGSSPLFGNFLLRYVEEFYLGFRLLFAFLLALHGAQKAFLLLELPGGSPAGLEGRRRRDGWSSSPRS